MKDIYFISWNAGDPFALTRDLPNAGCVVIFGNKLNELLFA